MSRMLRKVVEACPSCAPCRSAPRRAKISDWSRSSETLTEPSRLPRLRAEARGRRGRATWPSSTPTLSRGGIGIDSDETGLGAQSGAIQAKLRRPRIDAEIRRPIRTIANDALIRRWTALRFATATAEKKFRRIKGHRHMGAHALRSKPKPLEQR